MHLQLFGETVFFVVTAIEDSEQRALIFYRVQNGKSRLAKDILKSAFERIHRLNSRCPVHP